MKQFLSISLFLVLAACASIAQERTEETITTTDSTGKSTTVTVTKVGTTTDVTPRTDMIVLNPLKFFVFYNLSYFHAISPNLAVGGGFQIPTAIAGDMFGGFGVNLEGRFYPSKRALKGFYIAPNVSVNSLTATTYTYDFDPNTGRQTEHEHSASALATSVGVLAGWQWFVGDDFAIGLGLGIDHYIVSTSDDVEDFATFTGTVLALRFDIGYGW